MPLLTVKFTADPGANSVPAGGLWLITPPEDTVVLLAVVTVPSASPAAVSALVAAACVIPSTLGAEISAGPLLTVKFTAVPVATLVPGAGISLMTLPADTVELLAIDTAPTASPALVIEVVAAAWVIPSTLGTPACAGGGGGAPPPEPPPPQATTRNVTRKAAQGRAQAIDECIPIPNSIVLCAHKVFALIIPGALACDRYGSRGMLAEIGRAGP
jgi:hypothetical protein